MIKSISLYAYVFFPNKNSLYTLFMTLFELVFYAVLYRRSFILKFMIPTTDKNSMLLQYIFYCIGVELHYLFSFIWFLNSRGKCFRDLYGTLSQPCLMKQNDSKYRGSGDLTSLSIVKGNIPETSTELLILKLPLVFVLFL